MIRIYQTYLNNVQREIKRNLTWILENGDIDYKEEFLNLVIEYCKKLKTEELTKKKSKTRHG